MDLHQLKTVKHDIQLDLCMTCYLIKRKMRMKKEEDENEKLKFLKDDDVIWVGVNWGTGEFLRVAVLGWGRLRAW